MMQKDIKLCIPQTQSLDTVVTTSIFSMIQRFGVSFIMVIYDSILAGKRILISGDTKQNSIEEVQEIVLTIASLVSPPIMGMLNIVHPYVHLSNCQLLEEPTYIAGVINPMFINKKFLTNIDLLVRIGNPNPKMRSNKNKQVSESCAPKCIVLQNDDGKHPGYYDYKSVKYKDLD